MSSLWKPTSLNNCKEPQLQQWQSTVAGSGFEAPKKMTINALQRTYASKLCNAHFKDQSLLKLTNELLSHRENISASIKKDVNRNIYKLNEQSLEEIKLLTTRLLAFLQDIKVNIQKSKCYDEIIPHWKTNWDTNIDQWSCDVRSLLTTLRENVILALRNGESALVDSRKFTPAHVDSFLEDQVTKLNHLMIVNEKMYTDTERHLKLMFDTLLQEWLISYSYQEIVTKELSEANETTLDVLGPNTLPETLKAMEMILERLDEEEPEFSIVTALKLHLNNLRMCQQHVKLHLKEAFGCLKNHLESQGKYIMDDDHKSQIEELWMEIVNILKEQNEVFKNYSKQAAFAWNQFVKRLHCAENSAVHSIARIRARKLSKTLAAEQHMNILLDHLRESNSISYMEQIYDRILIELENTELTCVSVRDDEDAIIKQFITAIFAASDIFSVQLSMLNESYLNSETDVFCVEQNLDETKEITDLEFIKMKYCVFSAQTWIQGLKETMTSLETELPKFLKMFSENLINVYKGESEYWLMLQLERISKRKLRIRKNIIEIRASELRAHDAALRSLHQVIEQQQKKASAEIKKIKTELTANDSAVIAYLEQTKTNKLEDTVEKKLKHLADESLLEKHELLRQQTVKKSKYEMERIFKWLSDYCSTYLHSLRLFHEGGNYSSEECESAFRKITKIERNLSSHGEKHLKRLEHVLSASREAFKKKLSKIVYPDPTEEELKKAAEREANDRLEICFNRLKEMIKNETYKATLNLQGLKERTDEASRMNDFRNWHSAISDIESSCSYFGLSLTFPNIELFKILGRLPDLSPDTQSHALSTSTIAKSFSIGSTKSRKRKKSVYKKRNRTVSRMTVVSDTADELFQFNSNYDDRDCYLTNTKTLINDTFSKLRPILSDAYSKYHVSKEHYYSSQRLEAISHLKHYNLQCESLWTFLFEKYLTLFSSVYTKTMLYIELIKNRYMYDSVNRALNLKTTHKANLAKLNVEGVKESIDNKLKPWHGYPLNKPLLQQLLRDVVDHCKGQLTSRKEVNETYRDELKKLLEENKLKAVDVSEDAKFLFIELFSNPTLNSFLEAIWNYYNYSTNLENTDVEMAPLRKAITSFCSKIDKESNHNSNTFDYISFTFLDGYKFWDFVPHTKEILQMMKIMREKNLALNDYEWKAYKKRYESHAMEGETMGEEDEEISPHWKKLKEEIDSHVQDFENSAINSLKAAKKDFDRISWDLTRWKNEWISNIKEVNRLYLINPILDRPPHKVLPDPAAALKHAEQENDATS